MGAGTSALSKIESHTGGGPPSGVGGLEHGPDPSALAARVRTGGTRVLGVVTAVAMVLMVTARATGNVRDRQIIVRELAGPPKADAPPPPQQQQQQQQPQPPALA